MQRFVVLSAGLIACAAFFLGGCTVSNNKLNSAEKRIETLKASGVPDSALSQASVYLYQAMEYKKRGEGSRANAAADSLFILVAQAEDLLKNEKAKYQSTMDGYRANINAAKAKLTGLMLKEFETYIKIIDSLSQTSLIFQTEDAARKADSLIPVFLANQHKADSLRTLVPGTWTCTNKITNVDIKEIKAVENKVFTFGNDGSCKYVESMKGQDKKNFKQDYEYVSLGTWDLNGDTVRVFVNRFKAVRQVFETGSVDENGKVTGWKKDVHPSYDSLITDGSQDRYINWADMMEDFSKGK